MWDTVQRGVIIFFRICRSLVKLLVLGISRQMFRENNPLTRLILILIACICFGELFIMLLLPYIPQLPELEIAFLDMFLLSLIVIPAVSWTVTRPMNKSLLELAGAIKKVSVREDEMLASLIALARQRDSETGNHIVRTQQYVSLLAHRLQVDGHYVDQLSKQSVAALVKAAPLHDIGKVGIPDRILLKKGHFTEAERTVMKTHTLIGVSVLEAARIDPEGYGDDNVITKAINMAGSHHEKWDGTGYPHSLAGQAIKLEGRIMSVADVYDALVSKRIYKKSWTHEEAIEEIIRGKSISFDPLVVDALIIEQNSFKEIALKYQDS